MRLIDADWLLGELSNSWEKLRKKEIKHISITNLINNAPTAYDIDKVVEHLEENSVAYCREYCYAEDENVLYLPDAIEIVKKGGVTDD